jgi:hypothetical protein
MNNYFILKVLIYYFGEEFNISIKFDIAKPRRILRKEKKINIEYNPN